MLKALRWVLVGIVGVVLVPVFSTGPANADTNCTNLHPSDYTTTRYCQIDTNVGGARFSGVTSWNYADSKVAGKQGFIEGKIIDPNGDNYCATAKVTYQDSASAPMTWVQVGQACGSGNKDGVLVTLNQGGQSWQNARSGIYKLWACSPYDTCTRLWTQNITASAP